MSEPEDVPRTVVVPGANRATGTQFAGAILNETYSVDRLIGRGGMGEVYEGTEIHRGNRKVAIKIILPHLASDPNIQRMFGREADNLEGLTHPGLVKYRAFSRDTTLGVYYIVTEFVDGPSLARILPSLRVTPEQLLNLTRRIAEALSAAHESEIYHRDLCPDNILLPQGNLEQAKIIDFGVAKKAGNNKETFFTTQGGFVGRYEYAAPEQFSDEPIGPWTDIYTLALVILAVARRRPIDMGTNFRDAVKRREVVPDLSALPAAFRPLFSQMLTPDPAARLRSMKDVLVRIAAIQSGSPVLPRFGRESSSGDSTARRNWPLLIGGATAVLAAAGIAMVLLRPPSPAPEPPAPAPAPSPSPSPVPSRGEVIQRVETALAGMTCRWFRSEYPESGSAGSGAQLRVVLSGLSGGALDMAARADVLRQAAGTPLDVDSTGVWRVQPEACGTLDVFHPFRESPSAASLSTAATQFPIGLPPACSRAGVRHAQVSVTLRIGNPQVDFSLLAFMTNGRLLQLVPDRATFEQARRNRPDLIKDLGGDTYEMSVCASELSARETPNGRAGLVLVKGAGPFQLGLERTVFGAVPVNWAGDFASLARSRGWSTQMVWYEIVDPARPAPGKAAP